MAMSQRSYVSRQVKYLSYYNGLRLFRFFRIGQATMNDRGVKYSPIFKSIYLYYWRHREGSAILLIFSLFFAIFFHKGLISGTFYTIGDQFAELHPLRRAAWEMTRQGTLTLSSPYR